MKLDLKDFHSKLQLTFSLGLDEATLELRSPPSCSATPVPGTHKFNINVVIPDPEYRIWIKWYSSSNGTGNGVNVISGNPLQQDDGSVLSDSTTVGGGTTFAFVVDPGPGVDFVKVNAWTLDAGGDRFLLSPTGWIQAAVLSSSSSSSSSIRTLAAKSGRS